MKDILIPIDQAGRIVLPKNVRQDLAIKPGDMLKLTNPGTHVTLTLSKLKSGFQRKGKALVFTTSGEDTFGHEVVETLLNEAHGERHPTALSEWQGRKR